MMWGFWEQAHWLPEAAIAQGTEVWPNEAGKAYKNIYHEFFTTNIDVPNTATADDEVKFKFEAFRGVYDLMVVTEKGRWVSLLRKNFKLKDTAYIVSRMPL